MCSLSPDLKMGTTMEDLKYAGIVPVLKIKLIMWTRLQKVFI